jgi:hypothetical protein
MSNTIPAEHVLKNSPIPFFEFFAKYIKTGLIVPTDSMNGGTVKPHDYPAHEEINSLEKEKRIKEDELFRVKGKPADSFCFEFHSPDDLVSIGRLLDPEDNYAEEIKASRPKVKERQVAELQRRIDELGSEIEYKNRLLSDPYPWKYYELPANKESMERVYHQIINSVFLKEQVVKIDELNGVVVENNQRKITLLDVWNETDNCLSIYHQLRNSRKRNVEKVEVTNRMLAKEVANDKSFSIIDSSDIFKLGLAIASGNISRDFRKNLTAIVMNRIDPEKKYTAENVFKEVKTFKTGHRI